jgi:hypothetical protein
MLKLFSLDSGQAFSFDISDFDLQKVTSTADKTLYKGYNKYIVY